MSVIHDKIFPSKLLLFGEYSILLGSSALGIPFSHLGASLKFVTDETGEPAVQAQESNRQLERMAGYFNAHPSAFEGILDCRTFRSEVGQGLYLSSTIPQRYGLGSSGALCAAVYDRYRENFSGSAGSVPLKNHGSLRDTFCHMESFFHGKSSGFDPLVSWLQHPLLITGNGGIVEVGDPLAGMQEKNVRLVLVDTGQPSSTGKLVTDFLSEYLPGGKVTPAGADLCRMVNLSVEKLLGDDIEHFWDELLLLSEFQLERLNYLIPSAFRALWSHGLQSGLFTLKLCGSGGGGFLLCFTRQEEATASYFNERHIGVISTTG